MLVSGGTVVDVDGSRVASVRIEDHGRIEAVGDSLVARPGEKIYDATGCLVVPGGVDAHTHLRLPVGAVRVSDDFWTGTRAAAVGGTTTVIDYATAYRGEDPFEVFRCWKQWARPAAVDWALHMTFTEAVPERVVAGFIDEGVTSFKLYMAYPELLAVDDSVILDVMRTATTRGGLVTVHCEDGDAIEELRARAVAEGRTAAIEHARTRPASLEAVAVARVADLAQRAECPVYVVHCSSGAALAEVRAAQERDIDVRAETCPQYLHLDVASLQGPEAPDFVCTPPLREQRDRDELWEGLARGWIHTVATDHCPFWSDDRRRGIRGRPEGFRDFTEIPGGLPGIETRLALVWEGVTGGVLSVEDWVRLCSEAPARTFGLWPEKGSLRAGADADVVVWDPDREQSLDAEVLSMEVDQSPYEGRCSRGWPRLVLSRGRAVAVDGRFVGEPGAGRYLPRKTVHPDPVG
ncbi:MAG: dihydropyrimidinase [Acidimicrobiia bacterium]